jgi:hypothetical protein
MPDTPQDFINPFEGIDMDSLKTHVRLMVNRFNSILSANLVAECEKPEVRQAILYRIDYGFNQIFRFSTLLPPPTRYCIVFSVNGQKNSINKIKNDPINSNYGYAKMGLYEAGANGNFIVECHRIPKHDGVVASDITGLVNHWEIFVKDANCNFEKSFSFIILDKWQVIYDIDEKKNVEIFQPNNELGSDKGAKTFLQNKGLPPNLKWNLVKFILRSNDLITVEVPTQNWHTRASYHQLGMADQRKGDEPSKLWIALRMLCEFNGRIQWSNPENVKDKKTISRLNKFMKDAFGIDDNFFKRYSKEHGYVTKSALEDRRGEDGF